MSRSARLAPLPMATRFLCPHCHAPVDPSTLEIAYGEQAEYRICPRCDVTLPFVLRTARPLPALQPNDAGPETSYVDDEAAIGSVK